MRYRLLLALVLLVSGCSGQDVGQATPSTTPSAPSSTPTTTGLIPPGAPTEGTRPPTDSLPPAAEPQSAPVPQQPAAGPADPGGVAPEGVVVDAVTRTSPSPPANPTSSS